MKTVNYHKYGTISNVTYKSLKGEDCSAYKITYKTVYDLALFGIVLQHKEEINVVPFLFKTKDAAKEFLEFKIKDIRDYIFKNREEAGHTVWYETYEIEIESNSGKNVLAYAFLDESCLKLYKGETFSEYYKSISRDSRHEVLIKGYTDGVCLDSYTNIGGVNKVIPNKLYSTSLKWYVDNYKDKIKDDDVTYELFEKCA